MRRRCSGSAAWAMMARINVLVRAGRRWIGSNVGIENILIQVFSGTFQLALIPVASHGLEIFSAQVGNHQRFVRIEGLLEAAQAEPYRYFAVTAVAVHFEALRTLQAAARTLL